MADQDFSLLFSLKSDSGAPAAQPEAATAAANQDDFSLLLSLKEKPQAADDGVFDSLLWQESRGRQTAADGSPITSKKGAIGIAQVMPGTAPEAARLAGVEFDDVRYRTDAEYNKALGKAYFSKQLQDFGGDKAKALAAYNAGPGALRRALARAEESGEPGAWLRFMPAETQAYVPAIIGRSGGAQQAKTTSRRDPYTNIQPVSDDGESFIGGLGKALWQGVKSTGRSAGATGNTYLGRLTDVELAAEAQKSSATQDPAALQALQQEVARRKAENPDAGILDAAADVISAAWGNKEGTAQLVANQAPNSAVALGGAWVGGKTGAALGAPLGPAGMAAGGVVGALAGMFLGNAVLETGGKAIEKAADGFTPEDRDAAISEGAKKAGVITAVDAATFKLGGAVAKGLNRGAIQAGARAEAKVLAEAGINISDGAEIVAALTRNPVLRETAKKAGESAAKAASSASARAGTAGALLASETGGEYAGEYLGELAATGKADPYDAALEAISSFSQSAPQAALSMIESAGSNLDTKAIIAAAPELAPVIEKAKQPNSPLSRAAMAGNTPEVVAQRQAERAAQAGAFDDVSAAEAAPAQAKDPGARLAELEAIAKGAPAQRVTDDAGNPLTIHGEPGRFFTQEEKAEYDQLVAMKKATEEVRNADQPQVDEISARVDEISQSIRDNGTLQQMRDAGESTKDLLKDLAIAKSKSTRQDQREQAIARVEFALGWSDQPTTAQAPARQQGDPILAALNDPAIEAQDREELSIAYQASKNPGLPERTRQAALDRAREIVGRYAAPATVQPAQESAPAVLGDIPPQPGTPEEALRNAEQREAGAYQFKAEGYPDEAQALQQEADSLREEAAVRREQIEADTRVEQVAAPGVATPRGPGPAAIRKRKATLRQLVDNGLNRVDRRDDGFYLVSQNGRQEFKLDGMADAQLARAAVTESIRDGAALANTAPTEAQIAAGNYKTGAIKFDGIDLAVENPQGSTRSGTDPNGERWETVMPANYGYIRGSAMAADGDKVDIYLPDNARAGSPAWIIDQYNDDGSFDETKTVLGVRTEEEAAAIYDAGYSDGSGPRRRGAITQMPIEDFKAWAMSPAAKKPAGAPRAVPADIIQAAQRDGVEIDGTMRVTVAGKPIEIGFVKELGKTESVSRGGRARRTSKKQGQVLQAIAQAFGKEIKFFYETGSDVGDGFIMPNDPGTIYLNESSGRSPIVVFGHELMHQLERDNPEAYAALKAVVAKRMKTKKVQEAYGKLGYKNGQIIKELVSDLGGDLMADSTFWSEVFDEVHANNDASAARKIIAKLAEFITRAINALSQNLRSYADTGAGSALVTDMDAIRAAFKDALAGYIQAQGIRKPAMQAEILRAGQEAKRSAARNQTPEEQRKALSEKLRGTEGWLKAPNGKRTNLDERQWVVVRTPAFKAWFGDWESDPANASKAVDENGEPKVFYHGSAEAGFTEFDTDGKGKTKGTGAFFTDDFRMAVGYSGTKDDAPVYPAERIFADPDLIDGLSIETGILAEVATSSRGDKSWDWYESEEAALEDLELEPGKELTQKPGYRMTDPDGYETVGTKEEIIDAISGIKVRAPGVYDAFLNVRDLVTIDWQGKNWDEGPEEQIWNILDEDGDIYDTAYSQEDADAILAKNPGFSVEQTSQAQYDSTDDAARNGRDMGADGVLIKDVFDTGPKGYAEDGNVLVVYDPKNIKSASANTGAFDSADANITRSADRSDSPEFRRWFGKPGVDSNLVNEDGSPMRLYHGTNAKFAEFRRSKTGAMGPGIYLGDDRSVAEAYDGNGRGEQIIMEVYARGKYLSNRQWSDYVFKHGWAGAEAAAKADGWSGVRDTRYESAVAVWDPKDIKSATNNTGEFGEGADITRSADRSDALTVEAYHFSQQPRSVLTTGAFGTGLQGSDRDAIMAHPDQRLRQRLSFYVNKGTGVRPEAGVGGIAHKATLSNIYDGDADVKRLKQGRDRRGFESAVLDAGYSGYLTRLEGTQPGQVILLSRQTVTPEVLGPRTNIPEAKVVPQPAARDMDIGDRINANKMLPAGKMEPADWKKYLQRLMPAEAAELDGTDVFDGSKAVYKDELVARIRKAAAPIASRARQTETPEFKAWFGDSKVREEMTSSKQKFADMPPRVVYHATNADFSSFESGRPSITSTTFGDLDTARHGIFFAEDASFAETYLKKGAGQNVIPTYLSIQNPLYLDEGINGEDLSAILKHSDTLTARDFYYVEPHQWWTAFDDDFGAEFVRAARAAGFDGARMVERNPDDRDDGDLYAVWVAFRPEQIKSATGNNGNFDPSDANITRSADRSVREAKIEKLAPVAQRGERIVGQRVTLTADEKQAIEFSAETTGVSAKEITRVVREHKLAHPPAQGWAPLVFTKAKTEKGKLVYEYEKVPYSFNADQDGRALKQDTPEYSRRVGAVARRMADEVRRVYQRATAGDKNAENILAQAGWYKSMRARLRHEFGGLGDLFADLLGATSPNTPVRDNWSNAVDSLRRATRGDFDELIPAWEAWADAVDGRETELRAWFNEQQAAGKSKKAIKDLAEYKQKLDALVAARELPEALLPTKDTGKKYGFNGRNVARAMVDLWRVVRDSDPDVKRGGTAPKAVNFSGNLIGFRERATIDVWAARMLQRLSGGLRVPSMAEVGVSGEMRADGSTTLQFGFGQDVFSDAVKRIRKDPELKTNDTLAKINDDDLQAVVWFVEKEIWTANNWTSAAGEGGSFELEASLSGSAQQQRIRELRRIIDSSLSKPAAKAEARAELAKLERTVDRFVGGLSIQMSADTQGIDFVPQDADMARLSSEIATSIYEDESATAVLASKALSTEGRYGGIERSLDLEVVAREGYRPGALWKKMLETARDAKQDSTFLSRVLRDEEQADLLRHRPGVEIYFREAASREKLESVLGELAKEGVEFLTVIVDGRRMTDATRGQMPPAVGVRMQYVPEFEQRYGMDDLNGLDDAALAAKIQEKADEMSAMAERVAKSVGDVSFASQFWYETNVAFSHEYQEKIDAIATGTAQGAAQEVGGQEWSGQSVRAGLESADRQAREAAGAEPDGDVLGRDETGAESQAERIEALKELIACLGR